MLAAGSNSCPGLCCDQARTCQVAIATLGFGCLHIAKQLSKHSVVLGEAPACAGMKYMAMQADVINALARGAHAGRLASLACKRWQMDDERGSWDEGAYGQLTLDHLASWVFAQSWAVEVEMSGQHPA